MLWGLSPSSWDRIGFLLLLAGAALGVLALLASLVSSVILYRVGGVESELLRKETAEANARAKEAELALQKYKQPRTPDMESFSQILASADPGTVEIMYVQECTDCAWLAAFLQGLLENAKWTIANAGPIDAEAAAKGPFRKYSTAISVHANPWGITLVTKGPAPDKDAPRDALLRALTNSFGGGAAVGGNGDNEMPEGLVRLVIAPKA